MKETKVHTPEYVSNDILDEEFVGVFKFFDRLQFFLGSCRVNVKDQFVTAPTRLQKGYTILCILITLSLNIAVVKMYNERIVGGAIYNLTVASVWVIFSTLLCTILNVRFANGEENANFFIQMQKVDRIMGLDTTKDLNLILKRINQTSLIFILLNFLVMFLVSNARMDLLSLCFTGSVYAQLTGIVEIIYCSNLIVYFFLRIRFVNCIMKNHLSQSKNKKKKPTVHLFSNRNIKKFAIKTHDFPTSDTHVYLKELFDLFTIFQNLYRFQLLIFCLRLVIGNLSVFGFILFSIQRNSLDVMEVSVMVLYVLIDVFIGIFIGIRMQLFFGEVKETKRLSIAVMAEHSSGQLREKARKMLKLADETPPKLSVYGMYDIDAGIFLSIFGLITSLIVTLLQFALL